MNYIRGQCISLPTYGRNCWMTNCAEHRITGRHNKNPQCQNSSKTMAITTNPIPTLSLDDLNQLTSSINNDTITWSDPSYGAVPNVTIDNSGLYSTITAGSNTMIGGTGYTYTTNTTSPWIATGANINPAMMVSQGGSIEIKGEDADIKINGKSMKTWMEAVEERLNILTPNPELEADWDELQELGERYRALERKCKEKAQMWAALKKVQPKQP
jgi:hypothetical protein